MNARPTTLALCVVVLVATACEAGSEGNDDPAEESGAGAVGAGGAGAVGAGGTGAVGAGGTGAMGGAAAGGHSSGGTGPGGSGGDGGSAGSTTGSGGSAPDPVYETVVIDFDDVADGTIITDHYGEHAVFSSSPGCACEAASDAGVAASMPNYLFTYYTCPSGSSAPIFIDYAEPIRSPSITLVGVNGDDTVATVRLIFVDDSTHEQPVRGLGDYSVPVVVDMSAVSGDIKRLELVDVDDAYGLGLDDVVFDFPQ